MPIDSKALRSVMGKFATGVTVVTTPQTDDAPAGAMTANAVASLSLQPPLLLVAVDRRATIHPALVKSKRFAVNVLREEHEAISRRFAQSGAKDFDGLKTTTAATGAPILVDALAYADCRVVNVLPGGDHDIFVGEIDAAGASEGRPLLFFSGQYGRIAT